MLDQTLLEICAAMTIKLCDQPDEMFERIARQTIGEDRMKLLTKDLEKKLIEARRDCSTNKPIVKFFGGSACTWLISEYDPETECFFGLCDLGLGSPELGYVSRKELEGIRFKPFGLPVERDRHWEAEYTLTEYADKAREYGRIEA